MGRAEALASARGMTLRDAALRYAAAGIPVFPCVPNGKKPRVSRGFQAATTNLQTIGRWWSRWPDANIGIPTGTPSFDVVDIDCHPSGSGFATFEQARSKGLTDGWAAIVRTPSQGLHLYYPALPDRPQPSWSEGTKHIDFRGTGGYIIAPPSRAVGRSGETAPYELIVEGRDPDPIDSQALRDFIHPPEQRRQSSPNLSAASNVTRKGIRDWLANRAEGTRNHSLYWAASRYAERSIPESEAHDDLGGIAERIGLERPEITATIRSAYRRAGSPHPLGTNTETSALDDPLHPGSKSLQVESNPPREVGWVRARDLLERQVEDLAGRGIARASKARGTPHLTDTETPNQADGRRTSTMPPAAMFGEYATASPGQTVGRQL